MTATEKKLLERIAIAEKRIARLEAGKETKRQSTYVPKIKGRAGTVAAAHKYIQEKYAKKQEKQKPRKAA